jgi:hypothetical protein
MYKALYLSPMIPSFKTKETVSFFRHLLDFKIILNDDPYAILQKDNLSIHILPAGANIGQMEFYLEVDNIDNLWENIKDKLDGVKYKAPFDREYGMREIHIAVPETNTLLFIGQELKRTL